MQQHTHDNVLVDRTQAPVFIVTINNAKSMNCVNGITARALEAAFIEFEESTEFKVAILRGASGTFCAGADLAAVAAPAGSIDKNPLSSNFDDIGPMGLSRLSLSKPTIAAISGYCLAGGLELAAWCDLRVVGEWASLGVKCRLRGVPLIDGGTIRLPRLIGQSRASDLMLTGRTIRGKEAFEIGLANRLVKSVSPVDTKDPTTARLDDEAVMSAALELARLIASHPQECTKNDRRSAFDASFGTDRDEVPRVNGRYNVRGGERRAMEREFELGLESLKSEELRERIGLFFAKGDSKL